MTQVVRHNALLLMLFAGILLLAETVNAASTATASATPPSASIVPTAAALVATTAIDPPAEREVDTLHTSGIAATKIYPQVETVSAVESACSLKGWLTDWSHPNSRFDSRTESIRATATELFGIESTSGGRITATTPQGAHLTETALYQIVVLLLTATYLILLYTNYSEVRLLMKHFSLDRNAGQRMLLRRGEIHNQFLRRCCVVGVGGLGLLAVRLCDNWLPADALDGLPAIGWQLACVAAIVAIEAIFALQILTLWMIGAITLSGSFISTLLYVKQFHFAQATLTSLPFVLLYVLCPIGSGSGWLYLAGGISTLIIWLFIREIRGLFVSKNISNLQWFLYLCTIEIAPVAFAVLILIKHS